MRGWIEAANPWTSLYQLNSSSTVIVLYWLDINPIAPTVLYFFIAPVYIP